jgi:RNA polymerase sigma-70 factor (ECF subfamily)
LLYKALEGINPEYRQALHLTYFEGMSNDEVALVMNKSKKQVYNLVARGKQACREELQKLGYEE